jgi:small-conductance mechanosensitive channel
MPKFQGINMTESNVAPRLKEVVLIWWRFFWRYAFLLATLLLAGGFLINLLSGICCQPKFFFLASLSYGLALNAIVSFFVLKFILGRKVGKSGLIVIPAILKQREPEAIQHKISFGRALFTWWGYFWRFVLLAFGIGFALGALLPVIGEMLGYDSLKLLKYSKYVGNFAVIPASLLVFTLMMWRKEKRRKLDIVRIQF